VKDNVSSDPIEISLIDSVLKENLKDLVETAAEAGLDAVLEQDVLKQIPVFGILIKIASLGATLRDRLFARKLLRFLREIADIPQDKRNEFAQKLDSKKEKRRAGESILLLLERLDDMKKPEIIGRIVRLAILGEIDFDTSMKLSAMVDRSYISDLVLLPQAERGKGIPDEAAEALATVGLLERRIDTDVLGLKGPCGANVIFYNLSCFGKSLVPILES